MPFLRELVATASYNEDLRATFERLVSQSRALGLSVEQEDAQRGRFVVRCITRIMNLIVWRCWSDELLFELETTDGNSTTVKVYAIPNLLRISVKKHEHVWTLDKLLKELHVAS